MCPRQDRPRHLQKSAICAFWKPIATQHPSYPVFRPCHETRVALDSVGQDWTGLDRREAVSVSELIERLVSIIRLTIWFCEGVYRWMYTRDCQNLHRVRRCVRWCLVLVVASLGEQWYRDIWLEHGSDIVQRREMDCCGAGKSGTGMF